MSIQDLGALGELVAAIATIATLLYLAVQSRQNNRNLQESTSASLNQGFAPEGAGVPTRGLVEGMYASGGRENPS